MLRERSSTPRYSTIAEAGRVIGTHLRFVICIIYIRQQHSLDRIVVFIKRAQNMHQSGCDYLVTHHLPQMNLAVVIPMQDTYITKIVTTNIRILFIGFSLHAFPHRIRNRFTYKAGVLSSESFHLRRRHNGPRTPMSQVITIWMHRCSQARKNTTQQECRTNHAER